MRIVGIFFGTEQIEELGRRLERQGATETARRILRAERRGAREIALAEDDQELLLEALGESDEPRFQQLCDALNAELSWRAHHHDGV